MNNEEYLRLAIEEGCIGMRSNHGGPFGAVIVLEGKVIGRGHNMVIATNDPTAHAEIVAIRDACKNAHHFHIPDAILYSSCEPCPMCLGAIYWADLKTVYYSSDRSTVEPLGFKDKFVYDEFTKTVASRSLKMEYIPLPEAMDMYNEWLNKKDKIRY